MTLRIGLAVGSDALRVVGVDRGRVLWAGESPIDETRSLAVALDELLRTVRLRRWPWPKAALAVGASHAQAKRLVGLPSVGEGAALGDIVRENVDRFFIRDGVPLLTIISLGHDGEVWGAAVEAPVVSEMGVACRRRRIKLTHVVPAATVVCHALEGTRIVWDDGDTRVEILRQGDRAVSVRRARANASPETPRAVSALGQLGEEGWRFADAYGAAVAGCDAPLALKLDRAATGGAPLAQWRLHFAAGVATLALTAALLAPTIAARLASRRAEATLAALAPRRAVAARAAADLDRVSRALGEISEFSANLRSPVGLLGALTESLPASAQLASVQTDTTGGTIVALALHAGQVVDRLDRMPQLAGVQVVGPVTREYVANVEKERVTVRFHWGETREFAPVRDGDR